MPGVSLDVAHLEVHGHHGLALARAQVDLADAARSGAHVARAEVGRNRLRDGHIAGVIRVQPEIGQLFAAVQGQIALGAHLAGDHPADALIGGLALQPARLGILEEFLEVDLHDLPARPAPVGAAQLALDVEVHRVAGHAEHPGVAALGHLDHHAALLVHGHRLPAHAVGAEDHPLAVGSPLVVGLVDLRVALALLAGQEHQLDAGLGVFDHLLLGRETPPDLGGNGNCGQCRQDGAQSQFDDRFHCLTVLFENKYTKNGRERKPFSSFAKRGWLPGQPLSRFRISPEEMVYQPLFWV